MKTLKILEYFILHYSLLLSKQNMFTIENLTIFNEVMIKCVRKDKNTVYLLFLAENSSFRTFPLLNFFSVFSLPNPGDLHPFL